MKDMFYNLLLKLKKAEPIESTPKTFQDIANSINDFTITILQKGTIPTKEEIEALKQLLEVAYTINTKKDK